MRRFRVHRILALALLLTGPARADGLIDNVRGTTPDGKGGSISFSALLIGKDGRVAQLLAKDDKPPKHLDFRLDARGRTLVPGRIEPGVHLMDAALAAYPRDPSLAGKPWQPRERDTALYRYQQALLAQGVTSVTDVATTITDWSVYRRAGDAGRLRVRILSYAAGVETMMTVAGSQPTPWLYAGRLRMAGLAVADPEPRDDARVRNQISRGAMDGFQVLVEPSGAGGAEHALAAIEEVALTYKGDRRWRLHAPFADDARLAAAGVLALPVTDPAKAAFAENEIGMLLPGARADFLLLDMAGTLGEVWMDGVRVWTAAADGVTPPAR